jgi:Recombinase
LQKPISREELRAAGKTSLRAIAEGLNDQGIPTARGGKWSSPQVLERRDLVAESSASEANSLAA